MSDGIYKMSEAVDTVICDIEGTTTAISFVKDVLFPYVRSNLEEYLTANYETDECQNDLKLLINQVFNLAHKYSETH
jgi:enolase-phosphatase E1